MAQRWCVSTSLLLALVPVRVSVSAQSGPLNLDFEQGELGRVPMGWFVPTSGYVAKISERDPKNGKRGVILTRAPSGKPGPGRSKRKFGFGNLMQSSEAAPYWGKRVRFRAAVRVKASQPYSRAQLWLRVDREGRQMGFFDNMGDRPITYNEWRYYEIIGDVAQDGRRINSILTLT